MMIKVLKMGKMKIVMFLSVLILILSSGCLSSLHLNERLTDVKVEKKFIDTGDQGSHYILVTDKGLFEIDRPILDSLNKSRNPDLVYAKIIEGKNYTIRSYGYRLDWDYDYPIVVDANLIEKE